jgi:tetratricopeptide (TPR) repeat protein
MLGLAVAAMLGLAVAVLVRAWLPRLARAAFARGALVRARRLYRLCGWISLSRRRRTAARVSLAAVTLAAGRHADGVAALDAIADEDLAAAEAGTRAGWLNNRAYAALRLGATGPAASRALAQVREAIALGLDAPAVLHTEGLALLALGRADDAVHVFERLWQDSGSELRPRLEAERCLDLARAWTALGEEAYAADYRARARQAAPDVVA